MHEIVSERPAAADFNKIRCIKGYEEIVHNFSPYLSDESNLADGGAEYLFFPADENEVSSIFREMTLRGVKVTISGARTGLVGGAVPIGGAILSLEKFDRVLGFRYDNCSKEFLIKAQCGVTLTSLNDWVMKKKFPDFGSRSTFFYPPDPTEMSAALGGTVATNASGAKTYRYGPTRNWVRWVKVILASGEVLEIPRGKYFATPGGEFIIIDSEKDEMIVKIPKYSMPQTKNAAGIFSAPNMDLIDLFIGSEGNLGAITEVEVALQEWQNSVSIIQFFPSDGKAVDFVISLRKEKMLRPDFIEFYSSNALDLLLQKQEEDPTIVPMPTIPNGAKSAVFFDIKFDPKNREYDYSKLEEIVSKHGSKLEMSWVGYERRDLERFRNLRHVLPEIVNSIIVERKKKIPELHKLGTDLAVPDEYLKEIWAFYKSTLEAVGLEWVAFGHIGNNHFHINIMPRSLEEMNTGLSIYNEFAKKAVSYGGTVSAEHGIGKIKKEFLSIMFSEKQLEQMKAVKLALDPGLMINPGNLLDM
ncbi:MAG TPA: FAD-binding oxidoreductase [Desulfobacteraceae bacterium]|nr:FAD-binding oxidoreductase [Desulfobacteraceae bacterium]